MTAVLPAALAGAANPARDLDDLLRGETDHWHLDDILWDPYECKLQRSQPVETVSATLAGAAAQQYRLPGKDADSSRQAAPVHSAHKELPQVAALSEDDSGRSTGEASGKASAGSEPAFVCQADGCQRELTSLKLYHVRSCLCDIHMKMDVFCKGGREQRFCQQCGRCHELAAFDGLKRSCRNQLARRNARRRKRTDPEDVPPVKQAAASAGTASPARRRQAPGQGRASGLHLQFDANACQLRVVARPSRAPAPATSTDSDASPLSRYQPESEAAAPTSNLQQAELQPGDLMPAPHAAAGAPAPPGQAWMDLQVAALQADDGFQLTEAQHSLTGLAQSTYMMGYTAQAPQQHCVPQEQLPQPLPNHMSFHTQPVASVNQAMAWLLNGLPHAEVVEDSEAPVVLQLSLKLFGCSPYELPPDLRGQLTTWLRTAPLGLQAAIRPGCVHITLEALVSRESHASAAARGIAAVVSDLSQCSELWRQKAVLVQLGAEVALMRGGRLAWCWDQAQAACSPPAPSRGLPLPMPVLLAVAPACVDNTAPSTVDVSGTHLDHPGCTLLLRACGHYLPACVEQAAPVSRGQQADSADDPGDAHSLAQQAEPRPAILRLHLSAGMPQGVAYVEVQRGALVSGAAPVLVVGSRALSLEVSALLDTRASMEHTAARAALVTDLGIVMQLSPPGLAPSTVAQAARRLVLAAAEEGLPLLLGQVLGQAAGEARGDQLAALLGGLVANDRPSLLHRLVLSGSAPALEAALDFADARQLKLTSTTAGPGGITPLHLVALARCAGRDSALRMLCLLLQRCQPGAHAWFTSYTADGETPADFARRVGATHLTEAAMRILQREEQLASAAALQAVLEEEGEACDSEDEDHELPSLTESGSAKGCCSVACQAPVACCSQASCRRPGGMDAPTSNDAAAVGCLPVSGTSECRPAFAAQLGPLAAPLA